MLTCGKTGCGTGCIYCLIYYLGVTKSSNNSLCFGYSTTYRTVLTCGKTGVGTICGYCLIYYLGVTLCRNNLLCYENLAATLTVLTLGKTGVGTICSYCLVYYLGVTECCAKLYATNATLSCLGTSRTLGQAMTLSGHNSLCFGYSTTYGAMATCGKTGCGTGCIYCRIYYLGVTLCRNYFLCYDSLATYGAMATCGKTGCSTGCIYCLILYLGVTLRRNYFLCYNSLATYGAMATLGKTGCGTGRIYCRVGYYGVTELICNNSTTNGTGLISGTGCVFTGSMRLHSDFLGLCYRTASAEDLLLTLCGTGSVLNNLSFSGCVVCYSPTFVIRKRERELNIFCRITNSIRLDKLIGNSLSAVCNFNSSTIVCFDFCCAVNSIYIALGGINRSVNLDFSIYDIFIGSGILSAGSIGYGNDGFIESTTIT